MRDRLDGIKTKSGRVVYDRKPNSFKIRDVARIFNKFVKSLDANSIGVECEILEHLMISIAMGINTLLRIAVVTFCEGSAYKTITILKVIIAEWDRVEKEGGTFGGGGATRDI